MNAESLFQRQRRLAFTEPIFRLLFNSGTALSADRFGEAYSCFTDCLKPDDWDGTVDGRISPKTAEHQKQMDALLRNWAPIDMSDDFAKIHKKIHGGSEEES